MKNHFWLSVCHCNVKYSGHKLERLLTYGTSFLYIPRKMENRCSELLKCICKHTLKSKVSQKLCLYNSNKLESHNLVWPFLLFTLLSSFGLWLAAFSIQVFSFCIVFGTIAMLKNESSANHMPPRWYWMVEQNLTIQFYLHNSIKFDKIPNTAGWNVTPDHDRASTMFCRWLQTLTVVAVSWNTHNIHLKQKF